VTGFAPRPAPRATQLVTRDEFLADLDELQPFLESFSDWNEEHQQLHPDLLAVLTERGYFELFKPKELGGIDMKTIESMKVMSRFYEIDASTAWVVGTLSALYRQLAFLDLETAREISRDGVPVIAGQGNPGRATAEVVDGGYCVSGDWSYGSGFRYADLLLGAAKVTRDGELQRREDGSLELIMFLFPAGEAEDKGNWDVLGLRATGSVDYAVRDLFVPARMTVAGGNAAAYRWGERNPLMTLTGYVVAGHTYHDTGLGQRLLDEITAYATDTKSRGRLADSEIFRLEYAEHAARFKAAVAWVDSIWADVDATVSAGQPMTDPQHADARAALLLVSRTVKDIAEWFFEEAGGNILRAGPLQRLYRNIKANGSHHHVSRKFHQEVAKYYLGLAEGHVWTPNGLVKGTA
jgi:alkylation response protein AidB-like acyl-CoA dehydrogenase